MIKTVKDLIELIVDFQPSPEINVCETVIRDKEFFRWFEEHEFVVLKIGSHLIKGKDELLRILSQDCKFPSYFGMNWDALLDCLTDLHWYAAKGYILVFENGYELNASDKATFDQIITEAHNSWARDHIPFRLIVPEKGC